MFGADTCGYFARRRKRWWVGSSVFLLALLRRTQDLQGGSGDGEVYFRLRTEANRGDGCPWLLMSALIG